MAVAVEVFDPFDVVHDVTGWRAFPQSLALRVIGCQPRPGGDDDVLLFPRPAQVGQRGRALLSAHEIPGQHARRLLHRPGQRLMARQASVVAPHRPLALSGHPSGGTEQIREGGQGCEGWGTEAVFLLHSHRPYCKAPPRDRGFLPSRFSVY